MKRTVALAILPICLAACTATPSSVPGICGSWPLTTYTPAQQDRLAAELAAAPADAEWPHAVKDLRVMRQRRRATCGE